MATSNPSACEPGDTLKSDKKIADEGVPVESAIKTNQTDGKECMDDLKSQCNTECSTWHPPAVPQRMGIRRIGKYGIGAWRMGIVPSDVMLDKI